MWGICCSRSGTNAYLLARRCGSIPRIPYRIVGGEINGYHFIAVLRQEVSFFSPRWFLVPGTSGKGEFNKRGSKGIEAWKAALIIVGAAAKPRQGVGGRGLYNIGGRGVDGRVEIPVGGEFTVPKSYASNTAILCSICIIR